MVIRATTNANGSHTTIVREDDEGVLAPQMWTDLTLDEVKQLHAELGRVIEFAALKNSWAQYGKKNRRPLKEKKA